MYKVEIRVQEKGSKEKKETFVIGDIDSSAYHDEMNAVSVCRKRTILNSLLQQERRHILFSERKRISMEALYAAMYHKLSAYTTKSFIYRGMNT